MDLGLRNTRLKDYYDICTLCNLFQFDGVVLSTALRATLSRRGRTVPGELPSGLTNEFALDPNKVRQWAAFLGNHRSPDVPVDLLAVVIRVRDFLQPILAAIASNQEFKRSWAPTGPWREYESP